MSAHENFTRDEPVSGGSDRSFGAVFAVVFLIAGAYPLIDGASPRLWSLTVAAFIATAAFGETIATCTVQPPLDQIRRAAL